MLRRLLLRRLAEEHHPFIAADSLPGYSLDGEPHGDGSGGDNGSEKSSESGVSLDRSECVNCNAALAATAPR